MSKNHFAQKILDERKVQADPIVQFRLWFNDAANAGETEPGAMTLASSSKDGKPTARIVLLKKFDDRGFIFFTNYDSNKAKQLKENPVAALVFHWKTLDRQIRVEGSIKKVSLTESDEYFNSRPILSRISTIISPQSHIIPDREYLENLFNECREKTTDSEIKRPENWGGLCLNPHYFEFWQGRENRLHDRIIYTKQNNVWRIERLAP